MEQNQIIKTSIGEIHIWQVEKYSARIAAGEKKRSIERSQILSKLVELGFEESLNHKSTGQPFIQGRDDIFLSISHSNGIIAIYCANCPIGIDIEHKRSSLFQGRSYFVNEREEKLDLTEELLQIIWGAKEAFYKKLEGQIVDLKNDVTICFVDMEEGIVQLEYDFKQVQLRFRVTVGLYLVYSD